MRNILISVLSLLLVFSSLSPSLTHAQEISPITETFNITLEDNIEYPMTITTEGNIRTVVVEGPTTTEAKYNTETKELYLDGEQMPAETVRSLENLTEALEREIITPYDNTVGGDTAWRFEYSDRGSINVFGLAVASVAAVVAAIFTKGVMIPLVATVAGILAASVSSERGSVYYTLNAYSRPDPAWPVLYREHRIVGKFYSYSNFTGLITTEEFYY